MNAAASTTLPTTGCLRRRAGTSRPATSNALVNRVVTVPWAEHAFDITWGTWPTQISYGVLDQFLATNSR